MSEWLVGLASALWLGILTSVSPCPLATNIAAVSFIARNPDKPRHALWSGLWYATGRSVAYIAISAALSSALLTIPDASLFLQEHVNRWLGPMLIVLGVLLLAAVRLNLSWNVGGDRLGTQARSWGGAGAALLGAAFALSFCPVSAVLFFGSLVPLALLTASAIGVPLAYGIGTALPVLFFAGLLTAGAQSMRRWFDAAQRWECWSRRVTALVFVVTGAYCTVVYTIGV